ncbi:SDR family NAD(P)-dependent oxidoreductase [Sphingomonas ginkgonis]|uniref:SDR family NAD(P)-dependent oxidoreductase n=1 Tax=Sphingomonas ginkgonis TaxID=2315330 RepID=A0A3R9Z485_9SPHN|nr:SDR family NAD(P)-dependent oxidoreductase [Sphingomonas ginkgonis]RST29415.1 SDR family NAD(P)-dependent oxidoreductase [Sphingomonas ginkgonis]
MCWSRPRAAILLAGALLSGCAVDARLRPAEYRQLGGRTFVIVGASSGFGQGAALRLGQNHANVVLAARRGDLLEEIAGRIRASGGQALVVPTDAGDPAAMEALGRAAMQRFGRIDVWMNIAGVGAIGRFWDIPAADQSRLIDTNLKGVVYGSRVALRQFVAQGQGTLVNMGSVESVIPIAYHASYAATKAGVLSLGRAINQELRQAGKGGTIRVATVMPYAADTPFFDHAANYSGHTGRMILMDHPSKIVDALMWVSLHPREELPVGWKAQAATSAHGFLPDLTEHVAADIQLREMRKGAALPATTGAVHAPMAAGRTEEGGVKCRAQAEDAARLRGGAGDRPQ